MPFDWIKVAVNLKQQQRRAYEYFKKIPEFVILLFPSYSNLGAIKSNQLTRPHSIHFNKITFSKYFRPIKEEQPNPTRPDQLTNKQTNKQTSKQTNK